MAAPRNTAISLYRWAIAIACGIYVISPVDALPEIILGPLGLFDDVGALVAGLLSARAALQAGKPHCN
jgi:uncharacterized membrane protein YkvA (DUF1232 family)